MSTKESKRPVKRIVKGGIEVPIWRNESSEYGIFHTATISRNYRASDGNWASTKSLDRDSLLVAAEALREASAWIYAEEQQLRTEKRAAAAESQTVDAHDNSLAATDGVIPF